MKCPAGHDSKATDYCDVCGVAMPEGADSAAPAPASAPAAPAATECPHCSAANTPDALFCEACGYDFTTGSMPRRAEPLEAPPTIPDAGNISPPLAAPWVAEIWIDPDWYADQASTDPLPSPGLPLVVPLRNTSILIGRAVQLAAETGNEEATTRLKKVVDVDDEKEGTVRLKKAVDKADEMALDTASTKTSRIKKS